MRICILPLLLLSLFGFFGCTTTTEVIPVTRYGKYSAQVIVYDTLGKRLPPGNVRVSINELHSSAITDSLGNFTINEQEGSYPIHFFKAGFTPVTVQGTLFLGGGTKYAWDIASLYQIFSLRVTDIVDIRDTINSVSLLNCTTFRYHLDSPLHLYDQVQIKLRLYSSNPDNTDSSPIFEIVQSGWVDSSMDTDTTIVCYNNAFNSKTNLGIPKGYPLYARATILANTYADYYNNQPKERIDSAEGPWSATFLITRP